MLEQLRRQQSSVCLCPWPKKAIDFLLQEGLLGMAMHREHSHWDLQLGKEASGGPSWLCWLNQVCGSPTATVVAFTGLAISCCCGISWTWQENSYSSKASGGEHCSYSSLKDFQLE